MIKRMPTHCNDDTCPACVVAGDYIFLAHHAGGFERREIVHQMNAIFKKLENTLNAVGAALGDMVQINLYLKDLDDFRQAREVFCEYFGSGGFPARMTLTSNFIDSECLCMIDGVAYKPQNLQKA